jgi:hypothetical protein
VRTRQLRPCELAPSSVAACATAQRPGCSWPTRELTTRLAAAPRDNTDGERRQLRRTILGRCRRGCIAAFKCRGGIKRLLFTRLPLGRAHSCGCSARKHVRRQPGLTSFHHPPVEHEISHVRPGAGQCAAPHVRARQACVLQDSTAVGVEAPGSAQTGFCEGSLACEAHTEVYPRCSSTFDEWCDHSRHTPAVLQSHSAQCYNATKAITPMAPVALSPSRPPFFALRMASRSAAPASSLRVTLGRPDAASWRSRNSLRATTASSSAVTARSCAVPLYMQYDKIAIPSAPRMEP